MSYWESTGKSDEWYTPKYIQESFGQDCIFDLDVAAPKEGPRYILCKDWIYEDSLAKPWSGFIWMNPPFGGRNSLKPWLDKFFTEPESGIALTPDRTSTDWWQDAFNRSDIILFVNHKIKFERPDWSIGKSPSTGTTLFWQRKASKNSFVPSLPERSWPHLCSKIVFNKMGEDVTHPSFSQIILTKSVPTYVYTDISSNTSFILYRPEHNLS